MKEIKEGGFYIGKSKKFNRGIYPNLSRTITTSGDNAVYIGGGMEGIKLKQIDTLLGGRYETWLRIMRAVYSDDGLSPTIHTCGGGNMEPKVKTKNIIRKLTPRECFRLMSFTDADFDKVKAIGISDSQCYKQAGNSIVVTVPEAIFREMIVNKLAAYEDVGLTPEEVEFLQAENARLKNDRKLFTEIHETVKSIGGKTRELLEENGQLLHLRKRPDWCPLRTEEEIKEESK